MPFPPDAFPSGRLLLETDQIDCYDSSGLPVPCPGTGQDGETKRQDQKSPEKSSRFRPAGQAVLDRHTGLIWSRNASPAEFPLSWSESFAYIEEMNRSEASDLEASDYEDWRLPTRPELFSLVSHSCINPSLRLDHPFEEVFTGYYWTATSCARLPDQAWYVHFGGGRVFKGMKHGSYMLWPVRGKGFPSREISFRFTISENEDTAADQYTGLVWARDGDLAKGEVDWQDALDYVLEMNRQNAMGHSDWRLPNIREMESITDLRYHSPAISEGHPFQNVREDYWSSTTSFYDPAYAWVIYLRDGPVGVGYKPNAQFHLWPVRG